MTLGLTLDIQKEVERYATIIMKWGTSPCPIGHRQKLKDRVIEVSHYGCSIE